jgi:hypothetical protein
VLEGYERVARLMGESFVKIIRLSREPFRRKAAQRAEKPAYPFRNVKYTSADMNGCLNIHATIADAIPETRGKSSLMSEFSFM